MTSSLLAKDCLSDARQSRFWPLMLVVATLGMIACALVHRHLYGDGSFFMIIILEKRAFTTFDTSRQFAHFIMEGPLWAAVHWLNITDVRVLSWIFGLTLFLHPIASLWGCWHILKNRNRSLMILPALCWTCLTSCTSFFIISESWVGVSLFWPIYFLLLFHKHKLGKMEALLLVIMCVASIRVYEAFFLQAALLAFLAFRRVRWSLRQNKFEIAAMIALLCLGVAICADLYWSLFPRDPGNRVSLLRGIFGCLIYPAAYLSAYVLAIFTRSKYLKLKVLTRGSIVILSIGIAWALTPFIYVPGIMAFMQAIIRIINNLLPVGLGILPFAAVKNRSLRPSFAGIRRVVFAAFAFTIVLWQFGSSVAWHKYTNEFSRVLNAGQGYLELKDTQLSRFGFDWHWTMPCMSIVLSGIEKRPLKSMVLNQPGIRWEPFDPKTPGQLPELSRYGVKYAFTAKALSTQRDAK
jgi:hypothetical protein